MQTFANMRSNEAMRIAVSSLFPVLGFLTAMAVGQQDPYRDLKPFKGKHYPGVENTTLDGKLMCGYQGWFSAEGDGSGRGWFHYCGPGNLFKPGICTIDLWPDLSEFDRDEKYRTPFRHQNGETAFVFSPYNGKTVQRHFQWMRETGIDGVFLQRFGADLRDPTGIKQRNVVTANVQAAANRNGRIWALMYDPSGLNQGEIAQIVIKDWKRIVDQLNISGDPSYLHHNDQPVVGVWGVGFGDDRQYTLEECDELITFLKFDPKYGNNTVLLGVPCFWRTLNRDAVSDQRLHKLMKKADIISPWTIGRYDSPDSAKRHAVKTVTPDMEWTKSNKLEYLPVIFPGFSWQNLSKTHNKSAELGEIPRLKGQFLWSQAVACKKAGARMIYVAMFDEIDEGTAIFKCTNNPPVGASSFLTYEGLPSDHYLWLTGLAGEMLRGQFPAEDAMPVPNRNR